MKGGGCGSGGLHGGGWIHRLGRIEHPSTHELSLEPQMAACESRGRSGRARGGDDAASLGQARRASQASEIPFEH